MESLNSMLLESSGRIFGLDSQLIFDALVLGLNIFILFILLSYLLFNPVRKMLNKRQDKITAQRQEANNNMIEADKLKASYEAKLSQVDKEVQEILSDARKKAMKNKDEIVEEAKLEASRIVEQAHKEALLEKKKAADDVKKEIILVSSLMASKLVATTIDDNVKEQLLDETIREIGDTTWQN